MLPAAALAAVLVVSNAERTATLVDATTLEPIARFPTDPGPHEVAASADQRYAYVANPGADPAAAPGRTITVIDLARRELADRWDTGEGSSPHDVRASRDGAVVWAACAPIRAVLELDADDGSLARRYDLAADGGWMLTATPDDRKLYVAHLEGGGISIIDRRDHRVRFVATAPGEMAMDVTPDGRELWAANVDSGRVTVLDTRSDAIVASFDARVKSPARLRFTPDGRRAVLVQREPDALVVLDVARRAPAATIPLPHTPKILALSPDGARAFVTSPQAAMLMAIDLDAARVVATTPTGKRPDGVAYVGPPGTSAARVAFTIPEPDLVPEGIAHDPATGTFYVSSTYRRKIVAVAPGAPPRDFTAEAQDGLLGVVGLHVDPRRRLLWAASSDAGEHMPIRGGAADGLGVAGLFAYDLATGKLARKVIVDERPRARHFFNDLAIAPSTGDVFATDTLEGTLYRLGSEPRPERLLPAGALPGANGVVLSADERTLYVSTAERLVAIDLRSRRVTPLDAPRADGLALHRGALIAIHPWARGRVVVRYHLDGARVARAEVLVADHPEHLQPTTGVVAGDALYYIGSSQLQRFRRLVRPDGSFPTEPLRHPAILRVAL